MRFMALRKSWSWVGAFGPEAMVEEYIPGRELTVAVMGDRALAVTEIAPTTGFETTIPLVAATRAAFVRATALSAGGQVLGSTTTVHIVS